MVTNRISRAVFLREIISRYFFVALDLALTNFACQKGVQVCPSSENSRLDVPLMKSDAPTKISLN